jgi:CheY-like chemotaxis protein
MAVSGHDRELWLVGLGERKERGALICSYLAEAGYMARTAQISELEKVRPLGIILDLSIFSRDGWGSLQELKSNPATRDIPVLPLHLSEEGKIGGVFSVAGFFSLPIDGDYLMERLAVLGLTEEVEVYDLQALVISRRGEEKVANCLKSLGFDVVNAYTGKEAIALATTGRFYMAFCSLMLPDILAFELMERFRLYPQTRNIPFFVMLKDQMKDGERKAISRQIEHLVSKKGLNREEFLSFFRKRS